MSARITVTTRSPDETRAIGKLLGTHAGPGDVLLLVGDLGSGKTCLTQGILWGLGIDEYARSPTFVLVAEYQGRLKLFHMDLYRLESVEEVIDLALDEYLLGAGVSVVEWAEKAPGVFPSDHILIELDNLDEMSRRLTLTAGDPRYADAIKAVESYASQA